MTEKSVLTSKEQKKIIEIATTVADDFSWKEGAEVARKMFIGTLIHQTEQRVLAKVREGSNFKEINVDWKVIAKERGVEIAHLKHQLERANKEIKSIHKGEALANYKKQLREKVFTSFGGLKGKAICVILFGE